MIDYNLHNLPMDGYQYTWARHRGKHDTIEEKLDRALARIFSAFLQESQDDQGSIIIGSSSMEELEVVVMYALKLQLHSTPINTRFHQTLNTI
ncbi:hypothetical protein JHK87_027409 [Glycine soja]|nr:hypothetical protein JHK87_027409 [Glycine soja]